MEKSKPIACDVEEGKQYFWCSCGLSTNYPHCDGAHKGTEFTPTKYTADKSKKIWVCTCGQTDQNPLCDGSHKLL